MVVVSGNRIKNVSIYSTPTNAINNNNDMVIQDMDQIINQQQMAQPKAILICRPNSHQFQDRTLTLDQPVKVGRSVAKAKPTPNNAIFDCKVLSRHHALLWYDNGKFYLQDTKSSNGTFVNNNRLSAENEHHEVSSGDIVQFGVDVMENNKKVTHGCIIATLKLYLPDGKEAKASPSILDGDRHGMVPLDDLYRLNQIIQEASQREQCLESKLTALQHVVDETRKSAEESWQAYVGEERLLSRVSELENQLQQAKKNYGEDPLREELLKLQEHNNSYQIATKEALEKLHIERLEAIAMATEQERARISAEQEAMLIREQLAQNKLEIEKLAEKLTEEQKLHSEEKTKLEQREKELMAQLEIESGHVLDLELKLLPRSGLHPFLSEDFPSLEFNDKNSMIYNDDLKAKEEMLAENENCEQDLNKSNGLDPIKLTVGPVPDKDENDQKFDNETQSTDIVVKTETVVKEEPKHVHFNIPEDTDNTDESSTFSDESTELSKENCTKSEKHDYIEDSKTLRYQYQSAQNELKRRIDILETLKEANKTKIAELDNALSDEKKLSCERLELNEILQKNIILLEQKLKESNNESRQLCDKIQELTDDLEMRKEENNTELRHRKEENHLPSSPTINLVPINDLVNVEEELVTLKERFAELNQEKVNLQKDLIKITDKYNLMCNRSSNKTFFYLAPLVLMVIYLLVSAMIS